jgi:predicted metal-binding protein
MDRLEEALRGAGVYEYGIVDTRDIEFRADVRAMCAENKCHQYGKTWACPPAIGTVDECRARMLGYEKMVVFSQKFDLEDAFDFDGMGTAMREFKDVAEKLDEGLRPLFGKYMIVSNEGCGKCGSCTYPENPCRFPDKVHGSIEGYGILVSDLAKLAGINYYNGRDTVTFFGAALFCEER